MSSCQSVVLSVCSTLSYRLFPSSWPSVCVGIPGGLEAVIYAVCHSLSVFCTDDSLALLKIDMKNAFNECNYILFQLC